MGRCHVPWTVPNAGQRSRCRGASGRPRGWLCSGQPPSASGRCPAAAAASSAPVRARPRPSSPGPPAASPPSSGAGTQGCTGGPGVPGASGRVAAAAAHSEGHPGWASARQARCPRQTAGNLCPCTGGWAPAGRRHSGAASREGSMAFGQGPPRLGKQSKPSADRRPARPRRSRAAAGRGRVFQGDSRASARRGPVLGPPTSSADWRPAWVRRSRAAEGRSSAFQGGSRASAGRGPVLGPPRPSVDRCPAWPRSSTAGPWGGCQPSLRRQPPPPSWSGGSSRRCLAHPGDSGGPAASFPPGPAAPALAEGGGPGPAPAPPGFAGGGLAGWPWQPGCSRTDRRKPRGARWQTPAGHCRQRPGWAPGVGPGSSPQLRPSCCVL